MDRSSSNADMEGKLLKAKESRRERLRARIEEVANSSRPSGWDLAMDVDEADQLQILDLSSPARPAQAAQAAWDEADSSSWRLQTPTVMMRSSHEQTDVSQSALHKVNTEALSKEIEVYRSSSEQIRSRRKQDSAQQQRVDDKNAHDTMTSPVGADNPDDSHVGEQEIDVASDSKVHEEDLDHDEHGRGRRNVLIIREDLLNVDLDWLKGLHRRLAPSVMLLRQAKIKVIEGDLSTWKVIAEVGELLNNINNYVQAAAESVQDKLSLWQSCHSKGNVLETSPDGKENKVEHLKNQMSLLQQKCDELTNTKLALEIKLEQLDSGHGMEVKNTFSNKSDKTRRQLEMDAAKSAVRLAKAISEKKKIEEEHGAFVQKMNEAYNRLLDMLLESFQTAEGKEELLDRVISTSTELAKNGNLSIEKKWNCLLEAIPQLLETENQQKTEKIRIDQDREAEIIRLKAEIDALQKEVNNARRSLSDEQNALLKQRKLYEDLKKKAENPEAEAKLLRLQNELKNAHDVVKSKSENEIRLQNEVINLTGKLQSAERLAKSRAKSNDTEMAKRALESAMADLDRAHAECIRLRDQNTLLMKESKKYKAESTANLSRVEAISAQLDCERKAMVQQVMQMQAQVDDVMTKMEPVVVKCNDLQKKCFNYKRQISDLERLRDNIQRELIMATSDERMEQVSALSFEMETLRQQHRESLLLLRKYEKTIKILAQRAHVNNTQGAASQTLADVSSVMDSLELVD